MLVVDDVAITREIMRSHLEHAVAHVDEAADGWAALAFFKQKRYDAVLLDIEMPGLDGYETMREMRAWEMSQALPQSLILAVTSSDFPGDEQRIMDAGASVYLVKPVKRQDLLVVLQCRRDTEHSSHPMTRLLPKLFVYAHEMLSEIEGCEDKEAVLHRLHQLRGMVAVYGFVDFANQLKRIHLEVQEGNKPARPVFDRLREELRRLAEANC